MPSGKMFFSVDADKLVVENVDAYQPPQVQLKVICDQVSARYGVVFSGDMELYQDLNRLEFPFSEEISEEKADEIDEFLRGISDSAEALEVNPDEIAVAALEAYRLFNDFIRLQDRLKGIPPEAMVSWEKLGKALGK